MASPSSVARRAPRREVDSDDVVMMRAAELAEWARTNVRMVVACAVLLLVGVAGVLYYQMYKSQRAGRAASAYLQLQGTLPNDTTQAIRQLQTFATQYPGTAEADEARIAAAQIQLAKGDAARAVESVRPAASGNSAVAQNARLVMAAALAQAGKRDEAIAAYTDLAKDADLDYMKRNALNQAAALQEQGNNWKAAADLYTQMLDGLDKTSPERQIIELHRAEAQARAAAPAPR